jgi:glycosyltransferase involved in cell wall biosynthesis
LIFVGPFPPPLHGKALATSVLASALSERITGLDLVDISEGVAPNPAVRAARKIRGHVTAIAKVLLHGNAVYVSANSGTGMWLTAAVCGVARARGRLLLLHHHSHDYIGTRRLRMDALTKVSGPAAIHIVLSRGMAERLLQTMPAIRQVSVLNNAGLVDRSLTDLARRTSSSVVLGHLSNLTADKGVREVVDLAIVAQERGLPLRLILAGPAMDHAAHEAIEHAAAELGAVFEYRGPVYGADKQRFFADVTHFVFPTRYKNEASPLVLLEAMAAGVPCIATARGCIPEDLGTGGGIAIDEDRDFVEAALAYLIGTRGALPAASKAARARYLQLLTEHEEQIDALIELMS